MKKYLLCCILCLAVLGLAAGCSSETNQVETDEEIRIPDEESMGEAAELYEAVKEENLEDLGEIVTSADEVYQVLVPSGWDLCKNKIDESMLFEMQGETEDQYIVILVMDELSYGEMDIEAFVDAYAENAGTQYENAVIGEKVSIDVNENEAYTLRISGSVEDEEYINHIYVVRYDNETVIFTASMNSLNEFAVTNVLKEVVFSFENTFVPDNDIVTEDTVE